MKTNTSVANVGSLFFPLTGRLGLRVESTASPLVERKMTIIGVVAESFSKAETYLRQLADLNVSAQRIRRVTRLRGRQRIKLRKQLTDYYLNSPVPDQLHRVPDGTTAPAIAAIGLDGGRYQMLDRSESGAEQIRQGKRRKGEHWKESRVGCVMTMSGPTHEQDPMPDLPAFLAGGKDLERKLSEIGHVMSLGETAGSEVDAASEADAKKSPRRSRKKPLASPRAATSGPRVDPP